MCPLKRVKSIPGFAALVQAHRNTPPKQVRHPTDRQFASGYSPPRLATTQLPSATELWPTPTGTHTLQMVRHHRRTTTGRAGGLILLAPQRRLQNREPPSRKTAQIT